MCSERSMPSSKNITQRCVNISCRTSGGGQDRRQARNAGMDLSLNFLYDNCTTRAIEAVKKVLKQHGERLVFPNLKGDGRMLTQRQ